MFLRAVRFEDRHASDGESRERSEESYPWSLPAVQALQKIKELRFDAPVTFFVGENGSGKSTLVEAIAVALGLNAEGGTQHLSFSTRPTHSLLYEALRPIRGVDLPKTRFFLRAESFYNVATEIDAVDAAGSYGGESLHTKSHGESFLATVANRFEPSGLYVLDEPEAALSPQGLFSLMRMMSELTDSGAQFLIATHSPILLAFPQATIYELDGDEIRATDYESTDHYRVTRSFLENPGVFLKRLFEG